METLTFALAKGRLADRTMELLSAIGIKVDEMKTDTRKLVFTTPDGAWRFFLVKPADVPTFVDHGIADFGVVGEDTIMEEDREISEVLDLGFGKCRMVVAGFPEMIEKRRGQIIRVATKYPHIAQEYFKRTHRDVSIIKLSGSVELGPIVGLSDVIVDIVESGKTLRDNGLMILEEIALLSARLVVNVSSMKRKHDAIHTLIEQMKNELAKQGSKL